MEEQNTESQPVTNSVIERVPPTSTSVKNSGDADEKIEVPKNKVEISQPMSKKTKKSVGKKAVKTPAIIRDSESSGDEMEVSKKKKDISQPETQANDSVSKRPVKRPAFLLDDDDISDDGDKEIISPPKKKSKRAKLPAESSKVIQEESVVSIKEKTPKKSKERNSEAATVEKKKKSSKKKSEPKASSSSPLKSLFMSSAFDQNGSHNTADHQVVLKKTVEPKEKPIQKEGTKQKSSGTKTTVARPEKRSNELVTEMDRTPTKKPKKSPKVDVVPVATSTDRGKKNPNRVPTKPGIKKTKPTAPQPPAMDWFSAVLASNVQKKQVSRKPAAVKPSEQHGGRTKDTGSLSMPSQNKDVVLAAKFPHKRKLVSASEVLSTSHPKRPTSAGRAHKKPFT